MRLFWAGALCGNKANVSPLFLRPPRWMTNIEWFSHSFKGREATLSCTGEDTPLALSPRLIRCRLVQAMRFDLSPRLRAVPGVIMYHCEPIASPGLAGTCAFPGLERLLMPGVAADQSVLANISDTDEFQASNLALRLIIEMLLLI